MYEITDNDIINVFRAGALKLRDFGLRELELRYYGEDGDLSAEDSCDMLMVVITDDGVRTDVEEGVPHCDQAEQAGLDEPETRTYEGIGGAWGNGHYLTGGTFSYISDDQDTQRAFFDALYRLFPAVDAEPA